MACATAYTPTRPVIIRDVVVAGQPGMVVIIEGDTILGVEHDAGVVPPPDAEIIDGRGGTLRGFATPIAAEQPANMVLIDRRGRVALTIRAGVLYR